MQANNFFNRFSNSMHFIVHHKSVRHILTPSDRSKECLTFLWELSPGAGVGTAAGEGVESLWILDGAGALVQGVARQAEAVDSPPPSCL